MPFRANSFDKIFCSEVLEHVPEPKNICKEANRILTHNGFLVISVPNEKFINYVKRLLFWFRLDRIINKVGKYQMAENMVDEWHLHHFDLQIQF